MPDNHDHHGTGHGDAAVLRDLLRRSFEHSESIIALAQPADFELQTPCPLFDVRTLVGHMVFAAARVGAAGPTTRDAILHSAGAFQGSFRVR